MSDVSATPPPAQTESNSARKKRERAEAAAKASAGPATPTNGAETEASPVANGDSGSENSYIKELLKQIRNVNKKLNATAKADAVIAENPQSSLDDLLAAKKINADQKAQVLKKPALQAQLAQIEEQLAQYRKIDAEYQTRLSDDKKAAADKFAAELASAHEQAKKEAEENTKTVVKQKLLLFSQFLRAAAAKRVIEEEADSEESKAFEGALLLVYGGDDKAVQAAESIVEGTDEFVPSVEGQALTIKYSQLKTLTLESAPYIPEEQWAATVTETSDAVAAEAAHINVDTESDPTVAHAGLTELGLNQPSTLPAAEEESSALPAQVSAGDASANNAAQHPADGSEASYEIVPRNEAEVDIPSAANGSWADDSAAEAAANAAASTPADDGFHEVQGRRGGRGGRGRGRGAFRGEGGGRGRGGFRGERRGGGEGRGRGGRGRGEPRSS